jgi:hypothetical protein
MSTQNFASLEATKEWYNYVTSICDAYLKSTDSPERKEINNRMRKLLADMQKYGRRCVVEGKERVSLHWYPTQAVDLIWLLGMIAMLTYDGPGLDGIHDHYAQLNEYRAGPGRTY